MVPRFVHLHLHTEYSLVDGLLRIEPLMKAIAQAGMPAVALTDYNNLFAMVKFYRKATLEGVKPLIGVDTQIQGFSATEPLYKVVLLCRNAIGFRNLSELVTRAHIEGQHGGAPVLERAWLAQANDGLIVLSGAQAGDVGRALLTRNAELAKRYLGYWERYFAGNYYLELQRTGREGDEAHVRAAVEFARTTGTPVVATNDVRFIAREDFEAHEVRVCVHEGRTLSDPRRPHLYSEQQYLRSSEEMIELFEDVPAAVQNTIEIAKRCNVSLSLGARILPKFPVASDKTTEQLLREKAQEGLQARLRVLFDGIDQARTQPYKERLGHELDVVVRMGFSGYFLIVADFIRWAKENTIPVGPGRGSGAGSLVAYALGITDLDPLRYDLLFERFLNPERVSMPDFDVDFCMERRDRVIDYVARRYGRERVSQIITFGSMAAKAVVRDVGRALGHPYGFVDKIAKLIPFEIGMTLEKALQHEPELRRIYEEEEDVHAIIDMARSLEGLARNAGKHAGGVVISPSPLTNFSPRYCEPSGQSVVTQLDKDDIEAIGLVKFDFLGLRTLTIINRAVRNINRQREGAGTPPIDISQIPLDDVATYELLQRQETTGVFQLESRGIKEIIKRLKPDSFEDLIALVALYRPGPLQSGMVDDFILRKHGLASVQYAHSALEPILKPTYGVILYQEQVMQIAQALAGYTLGGADLLRRAMSKKKPQEMAQQRATFLEGATAAGIDRHVASHIFDLMEKFAGYGFNKSHSAAYALLSYQTAWLKTHHPAAFMAAVLSSDMDNTDKVVHLIEECRCMSLKVTSPDINRSVYSFTQVDEKTILYGLGAIKGVGEAAIQALVSEREQRGVFASLDEMCVRNNPQKLNRRVLEALIRAGALDSIGPTRASLMAQLPDSIRVAEQRSNDFDAGQSDLFGGKTAQTCDIPARQLPEWDQERLLSAEKETLGLYLTDHPIRRYESELLQITTKRIADLAVDESDTTRRFSRTAEQRTAVAGLVTHIRTRATPAGRIAFVTLDDRTGRIEMAVFADDYHRYANLLNKGRILVAEGTLGIDEYTGNVRLRANKLMDLDQARAHYARRIELKVQASLTPDRLVKALEQVLSPFREGNCVVYLQYTNACASVTLSLGEDWRVAPREELLKRLRDLDAVQDAEVIYSSGPS